MYTIVLDGSWVLEGLDRCMLMMDEVGSLANQYSSRQGNVKGIGSLGSLPISHFASKRPSFVVGE